MERKIACPVELPAEPRRRGIHRTASGNAKLTVFFILEDALGEGTVRCRWEARSWSRQLSWRWRGPWKRKVGDFLSSRLHGSRGNTM
jgi:hypothetical protein